MAVTKEELVKMQKKSKKSILTPHKDDIKLLRDEKVAWTEIAKYLDEKYGVKSSSENIRQFYLRQDLSSDIAQKSVEKTSTSKSIEIFGNLEKADLK